MDVMDIYTQLVKENIEYKVQKIDIGCNYNCLMNWWRLLLIWYQFQEKQFR